MPTTTLILPGLYSSGPDHWQTLWEQMDARCVRVEQDEWAAPRCSDWVARLNTAVDGTTDHVAFVAHSTACLLVAHWAQQAGDGRLSRVRGALLVAPSDPEGPAYPEGPSGFTPVPLAALPFPSIVVASTNDEYVTLERAAEYSSAWGSRLVNLGAAGHINGASGLGVWPFGRELLAELVGKVTPPVSFDLDHAIAVLARTPSTFRALLGDLPDAWTVPDEGPNTFSARDNLAHLLHGERTDWIPRAQIILAQGSDRRFAPYDRYAHQAESAGTPVNVLLEQFHDAREKNLRVLRGWSLTPHELSLTGEHPAFGTVTLRQLLATWVAHDLGHLAQTARVMAKQYRDEVGPWRAYLPIMDRP